MAVGTRPDRREPPWPVDKPWGGNGPGAVGVAEDRARRRSVGSRLRRVARCEPPRNAGSRCSGGDAVVVGDVPALAP
jgi:hypothetical protein